MGENKDTAKALKLVINYGRFVFEETKNIRCQNMPFFCLPPLISIAPLGLKKVKAGLHKPSIYVAMTFMETCWNKYSVMNKITLGHSRTWEWLCFCHYLCHFRYWLCFSRTQYLHLQRERILYTYFKKLVWCLIRDTI